MSLHPDIARLADILGEMADLCEKHANRWAGRLRQWQESLLNSDAWGLHGLLQSFGGMGSLNDVVLQSVKADMRPDNERFQVLLDEAWKLAHQLKGEASGT
ncbi:hypothetical protein [Sphingomonas sp.]|uniref:DUF6966 domain-containing protein n=1 Tax=Sphingomonas sp. TaxID=28214 RepID=UPI0025E5B378|nr:hypothetical protein [Sphingomonas sp.]